MTPLQTLLLLLVFHAALLTAAMSGTPSPPPAPGPPELNNCPDKCGDIDIPYPFGVGRRCSLSRRFALTCKETTSPPTLLKGNSLKGGIKIANITLETAQMVIYTYLTYICRVRGGNNTIKLTSRSMGLRVGKPFLLSPSENVFTAVGCRSTARLKGHSDSAYLTGCITTCAKVNDTGDDGTPCSGHGCCQASLTSGLKNVSVEWDVNEQVRSLVPNNLCQYAFIATKG